MITVGLKPDLQVLAQQVPAIPNMTLILSVALGVGLFLVLALLRVVFQLNPFTFASHLLCSGCLRWHSLLQGFSGRWPSNSGGVTTGPLTVPFIMALGIGMAAVRGGKSSRDDSFGLIALLLHRTNFGAYC
jgi:hypothetical protein